LLKRVLTALSGNRRLRSFAENSAIGQSTSLRFVAGTTMEQGIAATRTLNSRGLRVTLDHLGENVTDLQAADNSAASYHRVLDTIVDNALDANISCKLTHLGLDRDRARCRELAHELVGHAARLRNFVRVDMESSAYTQSTIDLVRELHRAMGDADAVGTVLQSYLYRSEKDAEQLCAEGIRIRLVKGAYREPREIAFQRKADVDANFLKLMKRLLKSGLYHAIATHDQRIIESTIRFAVSEKIAREAFEFQMLYGIRRDLQQRLAGEGWRVRVYVPFGTEWYPYLMRRLAERPANVWFLARNILRP